MAEVSVIIPTYNRAQKVARAIASVLYQSFTDYEMVVVDDGSKDDTAEILSLFHPHIVRLIHVENRGVSAARNTGILASRAPFIAFLDSDDYWLPEKLVVQTAFFKAHPESVVCQTQEHWIRNGRPVNPRRKHLKPNGDIFQPSLKLCLVSPSAAMIRRTLFNEVGLFDESMPVCEDYDLWLRISCLHPVHLIDRELVVKEGGATDQLSRSRTGMDRFRIQSMAKLLQSGRLNHAQAYAVLAELTAKCNVYAKGCIKRGRKEEGERYLALPSALRCRYTHKGHDGKGEIG
ncbi:MAG: glycosyltransferase family 2 protein [Deltaproteobacteria bacterium]|nr:glycosyltransferase family 2 protein [Deltaproteobacteria bacterium]